MNKSLTEYYIERYGLVDTAKRPDFSDDTTVQLHITMLEMHTEALENRLLRLSTEDDE